MTNNIKQADEDLCLAIAIKQGDQQALGIVYDKYAPVLLGLICRIVPAKDIAEEILQTAFLHFWQQVSSFEGTKYSLLSWMINITRQLALGKAKSLQMETPAPVISVYEQTSNNSENVETISGAVQNVIFDLVYYKGLSCAEAATVLKIPVDALKKNIRMAIKNRSAINVYDNS
jgi:RNA polymerase sigma-70 factor (ECF subfamily)